MWKHGCAFVCAIAALVFYSSAGVTTTNDPSTLPLLQFDDLNYIGAFKLPSTSSNGDTFEIGGHPVAFNPARNSLFIGSRLGKLAEVSIPQPVNSADVTALPRASYLQGFFEPTEGHLSTVGTTGVTVDGLLVYGNRLYGTGSVYYDADNEQRVSHFSRSLNLQEPSFTGWSSVWSPDRSGFVSGFMALVPSEWQTKLGGPAITGQFGLPIAWRTSWGPSAFAFNPAQIGQSVVPATPNLYYSHEHPTLGHWSGSNPTYGATAQAGGVAIIAGTRSILYFGRNGMGAYCYGNGTSNQSLVGTLAPDGAHYCYDPTSTDKGTHAYPYRYQIWAYDLNELAAVKAGTKSPWDVRPYGVWPFELPTPEPSIRIAGVGYDSATQSIYLVQMRADKDGYANRPIVHVLRVGGVAGSPLPVPSDQPATGDTTTTTPPPTTTTTKLTSVTIAASKVSPQAPGTTITLSATPVGGAAPHQYKWLQHDGTKWNTITSWSTSNAYNWTPSKTGTYKFSVWVRSAGNTADAAEVSTNLSYSISGTATTTSPTTTAAKVSSLGISANRTAPQAPGTAIGFSAVAAGGVSPLQFKFRVYNGSSWTTVRAWSTTSTYTWTPSTASSSYRVEVWARSSGNSTDAPEAQAVMDFPIVVTSTSTTTTSATVTSVALAASNPSPQAAGTNIVFSATPVGGVAPHQYQWWLHNGSSWTMVRDWNTSNTFSWTPAVVYSNYKINVHVRSANKTSNIEEAKGSMTFAITTAGTTTTTTSRATAVALAANKPSPQLRGTSITWTASASGGAGAYEYKFSVWNGSGWVVLRGWSSLNTFVWTPTLANPYYKVMVSARSSGNTSDTPEVTATSPNFAIQ
jgi:hypothetical protein